METILLQIDWGSVTVFVIVAFVCIIIFLAIREIMTWYWKIDTIIRNQEIQTALLQRLLDKGNTGSVMSTEEKA